MIRRFVTNVDPVTLAAAASALAGYDVLVEHVADEPCGNHLLDIVELEPVQKGA